MGWKTIKLGQEGWSITTSTKAWTSNKSIGSKGKPLSWSSKKTTTLEKSSNEEGSKLNNCKYTYNPSSNHTISRVLHWLIKIDVKIEKIQGAKGFEKFSSRWHNWLN